MVMRLVLQHFDILYPGQLVQTMQTQFCPTSNQPQTHWPAADAQQGGDIISNGVMVQMGP